MAWGWEGLLLTALLVCPDGLTAWAGKMARVSPTGLLLPPGKGRAIGPEPLTIVPESLTPSAGPSLNIQKTLVRPSGSLPAPRPIPLHCLMAAAGLLILQRQSRPCPLRSLPCESCPAL